MSPESPAFGRQIFYQWATREAPEYAHEQGPKDNVVFKQYTWGCEYK